jgi:hypothetical protein
VEKFFLIYTNYKMRYHIINIFLKRIVMVNFINIPNSTEQTCGICWDHVTDPVGHAVSDRVNHIFCRTCIEPWLAQGDRTCPTCRQAISNAVDYIPEQAAGDAADAAAIRRESAVGRGHALSSVVAENRLDIVQAILQIDDTFPEMDRIPEKSRREALYTAIRHGHLDIVHALLADGGHISELHRGWAVEMAAENGRLDIVQELLANGAHISREGREQAIEAATRNGHQDIALALANQQCLLL